MMTVLLDNEVDGGKIKSNNRQWRRRSGGRLSASVQLFSTLPIHFVAYQSRIKPYTAHKHLRNITSTLHP